MDQRENPHVPTLQRHALPELLLVRDVALALGVTRSAARKAIRRDFPYIRIGRRLAVRRDAFLATLAARETAPESPPTRRRVPRPKPEFLKVLRRHRGRGAR